MKTRLLLLIVAIGLQTGFAQDSVMFRKISDEVMLHEQCYDNLRVLCKTVGHRISGSPEAAKAVVWGEKAMKEAGADKVWLMPADVPYWHRGKESLELKYGNGTFQNATVLSLGNSEGTDGKPLEAEVIMVGTFDEFDALPADKVKGKIVFFNYRFRQDLIETFDAYGDAVRYRGRGPSLAASKGAVGVIIRSISSGKDDYPHTGTTRYVDSIKKIPAMAVGNITADVMEANCKKGIVRARIQSECHLMPDLVHSYNVIGEIKGSEQPEKIITVGGHLDSWDVGEGANDDGSGCVQAIEIIRALKVIGYKPKYTIRAVLFMNEENGDKGGWAYADSAKSKKEQHIMAIESDAGGFSPRGFGLEMAKDKQQQIRVYKDLFLPYGVYDFTREEGGTDISPLGQTGVPMAGLMPDSQRYFDIHHTNNDVFEHVSPRELSLGAVVMAQLIYLVNEHGLN